MARDEFLRRARLAGVETDTEGKVNFHFNDDDMLWGHRMTVDHGLDDDSWYAEMWG